MIRVYYAHCDMAHDGRHFVTDVPEGNQWLLVFTKTPARFWVEGELQEYPPFSAVLFRPGQKVYYRAAGDLFVNNWIRFDTDEPFVTETPIPCGVPFPLEDPDYCHRLFELIAIEHHFDRPCKESSIRCLFQTLFNKLLESCLHTGVTPQHYNLLRLRVAIQNHPDDRWTIARMADLLKVSPGYLQTIYKKTFGISCMDDVIRNRIRLAKEYLSYSSLNVAEIAYRCGYRNVEHFSRQFKQLTGMTPREYRKRRDGQPEPASRIGNA
ncbi:MAG: AraC family transcriptional regulator [Thermobacillus sp. ZCTH02-B1]|uniref:helix-turn-helix transcriptional regulator n=1 Tax=Thermobacillus sp. ZCTH02-B1 TaxID=1858795 RepID=UPI000B55664D|nr:AraC family transcriptional regulator [Thermobacillus sp. ZCTH02-B1]OUM97529.1 MAG: AraC family transcriptional regulator [Thermobacillus sp. ZCTH02-B1]